MQDFPNSKPQSCTFVTIKGGSSEGTWTTVVPSFTQKKLQDTY